MTAMNGIPEQLYSKEPTLAPLAKQQRPEIQRKRQSKRTPGGDISKESKVGTFLRSFDAVSRLGPVNSSENLFER
jgi:hypothetical protein